MLNQSFKSISPFVQKFKSIVPEGGKISAKKYRLKRNIFITGAVISSVFLIYLTLQNFSQKNLKIRINEVKTIESKHLIKLNELPTKSVASYIHFEPERKNRETHSKVQIAVEIPSTSNKIKDIVDTGYCKIKGFVKDVNGNAIESADILLYRDNHWVGSAYTLNDGTFTFNHLPPACYKLKIIRTDYEELIYPDFDGTANNTIILNIKLEKLIDILVSGNTIYQTNNYSSLEQKKTLIKTGQRNLVTSSAVLSGRGSRTDANAYYIDGVRCVGTSTSYSLKCMKSTSNYKSLSRVKKIKRILKYKFKRVGRLFKSKSTKRVKHLTNAAPAPTIPPVYNNFNTESYAPLTENEYMNPFNDPLSTFSIDVDNASYTNTRRMIVAGQIPPKDAVRIEEYINYFNYNYPQPKDEHPFSINLETATCPWNKDTKIVQIGLKGKELENKYLTQNNLVFLVDVSGSMQVENKLPLVKQSLKLLLDKLQSKDKITLVAYAGAAGLVLGATYCTEKNKIKEAIDNLNAGGSTAGGEGLILAYKMAKQNFLSNGNNRIILVTDGDFNVGVSSDGEMKSLIEEKRKDGIFLTVCGLGMGNYKDSKMETLANYGNGNYYYIDNFKESIKVFSTGLTGTLYTIAKDVKIQVEFNPKHVKAYRLIGYENRKMEAQDFANDAKDAGELGAGHSVTALYEIIPAGSDVEVPGFIQLKYQETKGNAGDFGDEMLTIKLRYKNPKEERSNLMVRSLNVSDTEFILASDNLRYACGVTVYAMLMRDSKFKNDATYDLAKTLLESARLNEDNGYKVELLALIDKMKFLSVPN